MIETSTVTVQYLFEILLIAAFLVADQQYKEIVMVVGLAEQ